VNFAWRNHHTDFLIRTIKNKINKKYMAMHPPGQHIANININNIHFVYYFPMFCSENANGCQFIPNSTQDLMWTLLEEVLFYSYEQSKMCMDLWKNNWPPILDKPSFFFFYIFSLHDQCLKFGSMSVKRVDLMCI
jgi:hypothetical protein